MKVAACVLALLCVLPCAFAAISNVIPFVRGFSFQSNAATNTLFAIRFTGLSTNLVLNTDYNLASSGTSGNYVVNITNLATGNYTLSDDNFVTQSPASGGVVTLCTTPDVPAITLDTSATNSNTYSNGTRLRLRLRFLENNRYSSIAYRFRGGENNCNSSITQTGTINQYQLWTRTPGVATCGTPFMSYEQDFNDALTRCNYFRDESNPASTIFNATVVIATVDTGIVIRGTRYARNLESTVTIRIAFNTNISTTNAAVNVFGPRITFSLVTQQVWDPANFVATVTIITSVQWPYQLATFQSTVTPTVPSDWNQRALAASPQDPSNDVNGATFGTRPRCYSTSGPSSAAATPSTAGQVCNQYWVATLSRQQTCGGGASLTLAGTFTIVFNVTCPSTFTGACSATAPFNDQITFATNSSNFCPQVVTNQNLNTATLASFSTNTYNTPQTQFVFGTTSFFQVNVTSPILMSNLGIESVSVTSGGTSASPYYFRTYTNAATWFTSGTGTFNSFGLCAGGTYGSAVQIFDNVNTGNSFTKLARFTLLWGTCTSTAQGDAPQSTTVSVNLRIRYTNQSTSGGPTLLTLYAKAHRLPVMLEDSDQSSASASVSVVVPAEASAAESGSSSAMVIGIIAGVAAATALLVGITVFMLRRGGKKTEQASSVALSSSTSTIQQ